jgi:hypothetical protein
MYWLMGRRSALSIHNKLMLYKAIPQSITEKYPGMTLDAKLR